MVIIYTHKITPRINYIFKLIFKEILNLNINITDSLEKYKCFNGVKINYSDCKIEEDEVFFASTDILFEEGVKNKEISVFRYNDLPVFFQTNKCSVFPFDPFAASFYLVTRYEEYLPHIKDKHHRYRAEESLAFEHFFLQIPVIDRWAMLIRDAIMAKYSTFKIPKRKYNYIPTYDIDIAFSYVEKDLFRTLAGYFRSILKSDIPQIKERTRVLLGLQKDPYDTYDFQLALQEKYDLKPIYFFLFSNYDKFDRGINVYSVRYRKLIKYIADYADIGIHSSYQSNYDKAKIKKELYDLSNVLIRDIYKNRQHYLMLNLPDTYRKLLELGITEDYTMGYSSQLGFRAGTCTPFQFYDLDLEYETLLKVFPFTYMDGTLRDYMDLSFNEVIPVIKTLIDEVKSVNGTLISLWHNESLSDEYKWEGWKNVYEELIKLSV